MAKLSLKYLPLAWVAVALTSLTLGIVKSLGIDLDSIRSSLGISSPWTFALPIYDTFQLITVLILLHLLRKEVSLKEIGFRNTQLKYYLYALGFILIVQFIWDISEFIVNKIGLPMLWWGGEHVAPIKTLSDLLILLIFPTFFCSTLEEILYRGYLLTATLQRFDPKIAFLINSLIFASIHYAYGPGVMLFIFFWNFIPCWLYFKSKSIYPSILFHSVNNLIAYVILPSCSY
ncbi:MAG TPA: CPBP family intramembrane metalloprotease [Archaeoglobus profundus]|nr:CPBP family intramembrane metalloprotease [Archaeoglobus profundus]